MFCLFTGNIYLSLRSSVSLSTVSEVFPVEFFEAFAILLAIVLLLKSLAAFELLF